MILKNLLNLGFSDKEANVYLTLLRTGPCAASTIARLTNIKRTSIYDILNSLLQKKLIINHKKDNTLFYSIDDINKIILLEKEKLDIAQNLVENLKKEQLDTNRIQISHYEGTYGYKEMYEQILKLKPKEFIGWINLDKFYKALDPDYEKGWTKKRIKLGIRDKLILADTSLARKFKRNDKKSLRETKLVSQTKFPFTTTCFIFDDYISFFDTTNEITGIRINNPALSEMMKQIFEMNWKSLK